MLADPKALLSTGAAMIVMLAFEVFPVPPSVEATCTLLFFTPAVVLMTLTENEHAALAASVPADRLADEAPPAAVAVPPHVLVTPLGVASSNPAGRLSVNVSPVSGNPALGFWIVKVKLVTPPRGLVAAPNALLIVGGLATVRLAVAVLPVPPLVELTAPVVFVNRPEAVPVTFTTTVHVVLGVAMFPPLRLMPLDPATAVTVPPHRLAKPFGVATSKPAGSVSANAIPLTAVAFAAGLVIVKVKAVVPFKGMDGTAKAFAMAGGAITPMLADAVPPLPPSADVTFPVVLFLVPAAVPVTFTEKVQVVLAAKLAPARLTTLPPAVDEMVPPPQLPVSPFGVETVSPAGKVSLKPSPVTVVEALLF